MVSQSAVSPLMKNTKSWIVIVSSPQKKEKEFDLHALLDDVRMLDHQSDVKLHEESNSDNEGSIQLI